MALGRTNISLPEIPLPIHEIVVTQDVINEGTFYNGSHTILTGQQNDSDGFTLVGRASYSGSTASSAKYINGLICWTYKLDITNYDTITFYAKKNADHGVIRCYIVEDVSDPITDALAKVELNYSNAPTTWTQYSLDVSTLTGEVYIAFVGGYADVTGNSTSSTSYCDIHIV